MSRRPDADAAMLALVLASGGKVRETRLPEAKRPVLASARLGHGTLIVSFTVSMRPTPWKAPTVTRKGHSFKDPSLLRWQAEVKRCAERAMHGATPYEHPVRLDMTFFLAKRPGSPPDLSNLVKSSEDALQGVVFANDRQVADNAGHRIFGDRDGATISVYAFDPQTRTER